MRAASSRTPPATASLLLNLELVATIVLAALLFGEHIGPTVAIGAGSSSPPARPWAGRASPCREQS